MQAFLEATWKSIIIYVLLVFLARVMGKKLLSQMTFFDFVVGITIGTISAAYVDLSIKGAMVLVSPVILTLAVIATDYLTLKNRPVRKLLEGEPVVIIQNGRILENNMSKIRYNLDDLEMQLREKSVFDLTDIEFAVMEPNGQLSVLKKSQSLPVTPNDLKLKTNYKGLSTEIIMDGEVVEQNLAQNNLNFQWLYKELRKHNVDDISRVVLASLSTDGTLYIDTRGDPSNYTQKVED